MKDCSTFGPSCLQPAQKLIRGITAPQSEDCLYLIVWTAAKEGEKRPVMVWIHGGGFTMGSGSQAIYDGPHFAEDGDLRVADVMHAAWIRFATSGDPNGGRLPAWLSYTHDNDMHPEFGDTLRTGRYLMSRECDLMDEISSSAKGRAFSGE